MAGADDNRAPNVAEAARAANVEAKIVHDYVMLRLHKHILRQGKIPTRTIDIAIDVVASEGHKFPEVRRLLMEELEKQTRDGRSRTLLKLARKILAHDGAARWNRELRKQADSLPQAAFPHAIPAKSPLLERLLVLGYRAGRSDIDGYVLAIRAAHDRQTIPFLLDVLGNSEVGSPFTAGTGKIPRDNGEAPANARKPKIGEGKWQDNVGGSWKMAKFHAAVGLAELGNPEGVEWLLKYAKPNNFGTNYDLKKLCEPALATLSQLPVSGGHDPWVQWWNKSRKDFVPRPIYLGLD